jgi:methylmalonyl-CoA carboxyltransferase small subunit
LKLQITVDGKPYEVEVEVLEEATTASQQSFAPYNPPAPAMAAPMAAAPVQVEESAEEASLCRSPVTGIVIKVNVAEGEIIALNDPLMVLEAMKMETNVTAPRAGKVKNVRVAQGDSVKMGQVVVEFE